MSFIQRFSLESAKLVLTAFKGFSKHATNGFFFLALNRFPMPSSYIRRVLLLQCDALAMFLNNFSCQFNNYPKALNFSARKGKFEGKTTRLYKSRTDDVFGSESPKAFNMTNSTMNGIFRTINYRPFYAALVVIAVVFNVYDTRAYDQNANAICVRASGPGLSGQSVIYSSLSRNMQPLENIQSRSTEVRHFHFINLSLSTTFILRVLKSRGSNNLLKMFQYKNT